MDSKLKHKTLVLLTALVGLGMLIPPPAYGYLDPGTGSLIVQGAIAAVVGIGMSVKLYWSRIKMVISRSSEADSSE